MTEAEHDQIQLILEDLRDRAQTSLESDSGWISHERVAGQRSKAEAFLRIEVRELEQAASALVADGREKIGAVSTEIEAFSMLSNAAERFLAWLPGRLESVLSIHLAHARDRESGEAVAAYARTLLSDALTRIRRQLELERFAFTQPSREADPSGSGSRSIRPTAPTKGGRPLAAHWDEMWTAIAVMLFVGDLKPTKQADIEKAMTEWIEDQGLSAAPSTVRARARRLWDALVATDA